VWIRKGKLCGRTLKVYQNTNEKIEQFINMYIYYDMSLSPNPLQNAQQH
jgi:hypothetical protein